MLQQRDHWLQVLYAGVADTAKGGHIIMLAGQGLRMKTPYGLLQGKEDGRQGCPLTLLILG